MTFRASVRRVLLERYATFSGRASRSEFWWFVLFCFAASFVLSFLERLFTGGEPGNGLLGAIFSLAALIPSLAVSVRRLHDIDRTGWWLLLGLVPLVGVIVLLIFYVLPGTPGANRFGSNPKDGDGSGRLEPAEPIPSSLIPRVPR
ncbi:MAG: DUF805 domain-containing protein [Pseudomonadota bacterium]